MHTTPHLIRRLAFTLTLPALLAGLVWLAARMQQPIAHDVITDPIYGSITIAHPLIMPWEQVVVFADTKKFRAADLADRLARSGAAAAIVDTGRAFQALTDVRTRCLVPERVFEPVQILSQWAHGAKEKRPVLAGIGDGALLPFLFAGTKSGNRSRNLSVGFSVRLPDNVQVCAPLAAMTRQGHRELTSSPPLQGAWRAAWADQPEGKTAVFVRKVPGAATAIGPYGAPLDTVAVSEVQAMLAAGNPSQASRLPVVEVPAKNPKDTVTLFYSGDGGWRDLDRDVAGHMAEQGYPVVGIDTLRAFWSSKTPETAAAELAELMAYYRTRWKAEKFALAGYSFGADILPALYNRLPQTDREAIGVIVLLALGKTADFEIHVSGWIGQDTAGLPVLPELDRIEARKILCVYGEEEKDESACRALSASGARLLELPGGHHFDQDYAALAARIIDAYRESGRNGSN